MRSIDQEDQVTSPGEAIADRLADHLIGRLSAVGYFAQLGTGLWLAVTLIFDIGSGRFPRIPESNRASQPPDGREGRGTRRAAA